MRLFLVVVGLGHGMIDVGVFMDGVRGAFCSNLYRGPKLVTLLSLFLKHPDLV